MAAVNGTEMWKSSNYVGSKSSDKTIYLATEDFGLTDQQTWYAMYKTEDTLVTYYCGTVMSWHFEGLLVMSKTTALNPAETANVQKIVESLGFTEDQLCTANPAEACDRAPASAFFMQ